SLPVSQKVEQERAARSCELRNRDTSAETLRKRKRAAAAMSGRPDRRDIHGAAAERDVERVSAEQVDQGDEDEQERRLPARLGADQMRLSEQVGIPNTGKNTTASGRHGAPAAPPPEEAAGGGGQGEGNRGELNGEKNRGEPPQVKPEPLRREQAEHPIHARERSCEPKEVHLPQRQPQCEKNAQPGKG